MCSTSPFAAARIVAGVSGGSGHRRPASMPVPMPIPKDPRTATDSADTHPARLTRLLRTCSLDLRRFVPDLPAAPSGRGGRTMLR